MKSMQNKKIDIIVTDDHKLFRKGMAALLSDFKIVNEIYEAGNGIELLDLLEKTEPRPGLVLLDLNMPEMDGSSATQKIRQKFPEVKIIILTMEDDEQYILHLVDSGINGYLNKSAEPEEVEMAIEKVLTMDYYFPEEISGLIYRNLKKFGKSKIKMTVEFTEQEKQILELICRQRTTAEIAENINLSIRTVEGYRKKLLVKTGARNIVGLVVYAFKYKLVQL